MSSRIFCFMVMHEMKAFALALRGVYAWPKPGIEDMGPGVFRSQIKPHTHTQSTTYIKRRKRKENLPTLPDEIHPHNPHVQHNQTDGSPPIRTRTAPWLNLESQKYLRRCIDSHVYLLFHYTEIPLSLSLSHPFFTSVPGLLGSHLVCMYVYTRRI